MGSKLLGNKAKKNVTWDKEMQQILSLEKLADKHLAKKKTFIIYL